MPRIFIVTLPDGLLVFDSPFRDALDDYDPEYSVYHLPWTEAKRLHGRWDSLVEGAELRGRIPVTDVEFDETRRKLVATRVIDSFAKPFQRTDVS